MNKLSTIRFALIRRQHVAATVGVMAALACASVAKAEVTTLTFPPASPTCLSGPCVDNSTISQAHGDSAKVDVSYRAIVAATGLTYRPEVYYWSTGYGDLDGVVYGGNDSANFIAEILFRPAAGFELALRSFDAGCYFNRSSCQTLTYNFATGGGVALGSGTAALPARGHASLAINSAYFADGIRLQWGPDSYDVGLDNIAFDVRAIGIGGVPEPTLWAMMIVGFGIIGAALRRRKPVLTPQRLLTA